MHDRSNASGWSGPLRRPARPWDSVILPAMVKENLLLDVKEFMSKAEKAWYASKGELTVCSEADW
jgi:chaperone BCS1